MLSLAYKKTTHLDVLMKNTNLLFEYNVEKTINVSMKRQKCIIKCHSKILTGDGLLHIVKSINGIAAKYPTLKPLIIIDFGQIMMADKLVYIMLEEICLSIVRDLGFLLRIKIQVTRNVIANGFDENPLKLLTGDGNVVDQCRRFVESCELPLSFTRNHYRQIVSGKESDESDIFCTIMSEVRKFLQVYYGDLERIEQIAEIVVELCGNAWEHTRSDCLIDMDAADDYLRIDSGEKFGCINIAILNLCKNLIGDDLHKKLLCSDLNELGERYLSVSEAYEKHKEKFNALYTEEAFYGIAAFQDKVSGRPGKDMTGGTGLPQLIKSLERGFENLICYCCSGHTVIFFDPEVLTYNEAGWIGFNSQCDFINSIPQKGIIGKSPLYLPGTGFNLMFIFRRSF